MKFGAVLLVAGVFFFSLQKVGLGDGVRVVLEKLSVPFTQSSGRFRAFVYAPFVFIESAQHAEQENVSLREERAELLSFLELRNVEQLKKQDKNLLAQRDATFLPTLFIGAEQPMIPIGMRQGIEEGAMVSSHDVLVGIVTRVGAQFSQVETLSHLRRKLTVRVREVEAQGLLEQEKGEVMLTHVRPDASLKEGQIVTTFGSSDGILPYVPIAKVKKVLSSPADPFHRASLELLIIPKDGGVVSVLQNAALPEHMQQKNALQHYVQQKTGETQ